MKSAATEAIAGTVTRVEHYGLYVRTAEGDALVLIPDVSSTPIELRSAYAVGDPVEVRLLLFVEERKLYKATMIAEAPKEDAPAPVGDAPDTGGMSF